MFKVPYLYLLLNIIYHSLIVIVPVSVFFGTYGRVKTFVLRQKSFQDLFIFMLFFRQ